MSKCLPIVVSGLFAPLAHAHPGAHHGDLWAGLVHLLTQPDHLLWLLLALGLGATFAYWRLRQIRTRK